MRESAEKREGKNNSFQHVKIINVAVGMTANSKQVRDSLMPVEQSFETKDAAPEFLREHLTEDGGKFVFRAELPGEVGGLKNALKAERDAKAALEKSLKGFEGIDPTKAREMLAAQQKAEEEAAKAKGDWENWKKQMQEQHNAEKQALEAKLTQTEQAYETEFVDAKITAEIANAKGKARLLKSHVGAKSVVEAGKREIRIYDDAGNVRYGKDGKPMTVAERIAEMQKDPEFMVAFEASGTGGSGAPPNSSGGKGGGHTLSRAEAYDPARYRAAKEAAEKAGQTLEITD